MSSAYKPLLGWIPCFVLLLSLALVSGGDSQEGSQNVGDGPEEASRPGQGLPLGLASGAVECVDPGSCRRAANSHGTGDQEGLGLSLKSFLEALVSKRGLEKRAKQDSGITGFSAAEKSAIVRIHNDLRKSVKPPASDMLEMSWSDELEKVANDYARTCNFQHNPNRAKQAPSYTSVGENIYAHSNSYSETGAVQAWFDEDQYYNYNTMACSHICGHYTQVVWAKSFKVGCGVRYCDPLRSVSFGSGYIIVCNYGPAGNYRGQRPYTQGNSPTQLLNPSGSDSAKSTPKPNTPSNPTPKPSGSSPTRPKRPKKTRKNRKNRKNRNRTKRPRSGKRRKSKKNNGNKNSNPQASTILQADQTRTPTPTTSTSDWRRKLSSTCRRGRQQALDLQSQLRQELLSAQPSSPAWRRRVSNTCSRGRSQLSALRTRLRGCMRRRG